ncbi:MAG: monovalent cation/H+ antiporter subunit D family protein [Candidatus Aminicenantes bacterium]|nr:monovalent cation/H+ antiporter subunit D family protein [Candidatus Aminicenantes bacterium]
MTWIWTNAPALPVVLLLPAAIIIPLAALIDRRLARALALAASLAAVALGILNLVRVLADGPVRYFMGGWPPPIGIEYVLDPLSAFVILVVNAIGFLVLLHAGTPVARELPEAGQQVPYYAVAVLMLCGFNGIVVTGDFFNLYVWLEISSLSLYGLIAVGGRKAPVAAFRYLILGTIGACFYLLGLGFLFTMTGTLNMADLKAILPAVSAEPAVAVGLGLIVAGMGLKMALFPLHGWLPDAYTYAPSASSALIAPLGTKVGAYVLIRILFFVFGVGAAAKAFPLTTVVGWLAAGGILYGSVMAMAQRELKRMLAYSSIAQVGYIGLGIGLANPLGLIGAILHVMNHAAMKGLLFLVAGNFRTVLGHSDIARLDGSARRRMPWTTAAFAVGALSMIGIPPLAGFFSKWYLALGAVARKQWVFLAVILVSSLLNAVYFFRVLERVYLVKPDAEEDAPRTEVTASMRIPVLILAAALVLLGVLNAAIVKGVLAKVAAAALF